MNRILLSLTSACSFALIAISANLHAAEVQPSESPDGSLLPALEKIARDDGDHIFTITEIYKGQSRSVEIREGMRCHNSYSIAKLFTVVTIGIMEDKGLLDVDDPVFPILEKEFPDTFDPKWRDVKISDVLRHRVGYGVAGFLDIDAQNASTWKERDFLKIALGEPLEFKPGEKFVYTDAAFYVAACIGGQVAGEKFNEFMVRELLEPLEFAEYAFSTDPQGRPIGATGLYISTEDMAKLGEMLVNDGEYHGRRILSKEFVDKAFARTFELYPVGKQGVAFTKGGMNGQILYMNRATKRVVAAHSYHGDVDAILKYLEEHDR
ncbi:MAG: serine hydrolase domain-containing protein [Planctomycetia bacterium]|nr:serine hydrolase domain-containing protein [Planctomycetia bacterium]